MAKYTFEFYNLKSDPDKTAVKIVEAPTLTAAVKTFLEQFDEKDISVISIKRDASKSDSDIG